PGRRPVVAPPGPVARGRAAAGVVEAPVADQIVEQSGRDTAGQGIDDAAVRARIGTARAAVSLLTPPPAHGAGQPGPRPPSAHGSGSTAISVLGEHPPASAAAATN